jgi:hypothetical protein
MWHWQRKNVPKKIEVWTHFFIASLIIHALLMVGFFSSGFRQAEHLILTMRKGGATVPVTLKSYTSYAQSTKTTASRAAAPTVKPKAPVKPVQPTKMAAIKPTPKAEKKVAKAEPPKPKPVVKEPEKKKTPVIEKVPEAFKKATPTPPQPAENNTIPSTQTYPPKDSFDNDKIPPYTQEFSLQGNFANEVRDSQLYTAVSRHWAPPPGIARDCSCDITVSIGYDQSVIKVEISKKSGILMYDLAARKAAMMTTFPAWTRGKTVTIRFVQ